ncbi:hypothetical protein NLG07_02030 [Alteromonas sp. LMIT006]|jgi:membrane-bound ClpP family serine protease|uniref:hypothetical protein n=1 Tax=Alteromonadaceae TaxID=72275 RepID=UPI0020CA8B2E|nr:hypothetical protein [Alteromonas sp. LMIT006]UTP73040.1 hypothetical protein NLG07_02030 [Alteromonas sp. LMIT006]
MSDSALITMLKIVMVVGISLILLGVYFHVYSDYMHSLGVTGIIISACCVAIGMIMSIPTKMYLTFILVKRASEKSDS